MAGFLPGGLAQSPVTSRFVSIGVEQGLSRGAVTELYQDNRGYFWISTEDGLNRYDGEEIRTYRSGTDLARRGRKANHPQGNLCEDENHNIWYVNEGGIYCCDPVRMKLIHRPYPAGFEAPADLKAIAILSPGKSLWLFSASRGLYRCDYSRAEISMQFFALPFPVETTEAVPQADDQQQILIATGTERGVLVFDTRKEQYYTVFGGTPVKKVWHQPGLYFLLTNNALLRCYTLQRAADFIPLFGSSPITGIAEDRQERVWACSSQEGLWHFDRQQRRWTKYQPDHPRTDKIFPNFLTDLCLDQSDNLWIGSAEEGVYRLNTRTARFHAIPSGKERGLLKSVAVSAILANTDSSVWIGMRGEGVYRVMLPGGHPDRISPHYGKFLFKDGSGNLWTGGKGTTALLAGGKKNGILREMEVLRGITIHKMVQMSGDVLLAAPDSGLVEIRLRNAVQGAIDISLPAVPLKSYTDLWAAPDGSVWAIAPKSGLWHFGRDQASGWQVIGQHLQTFEINDMEPDPNRAGRLWLATTEGLMSFDTERGDNRLYTQEDGLSFRMIYSVVKDSCCDIWLATEAGLSRMQEYERGGIFYNYDLNDGLAQTDFYPGVCDAGTAGYTCFGGPQGLVWFATRESKVEIRQKPLISIDQIRVNGDIVSGDSGKVNIPILQLPTTENDLDFRFAVLDFTQPAANKIQYILEGRDNNWFTSTRERIVRYTNLPPGFYTLRVKGSNAQGIWSEEKQLKILIKAPFWRRSNIFLILWFSLFIGAVWWINIRNKKVLRERLALLKRQRAIEEERSRIAKDMHDEIGSGLSQIALMTELMNAEKTDDKQARQHARDIGSNARKLVQSISEIIWALNTQQDSLDSLLAYMREQTYSFFEPFEDRVHYEVDFPDHIPAHPLGNQQRRNLYLVAKEALNNALKHSNAKNIRLTLHYDPHLLTFSVTDDGRGLDFSKKPSGGGFGLPGMRRRMEEIGGDIAWKNPENGGTAVVFRMPLP